MANTSPLTVLFVTFNCGRELIDADFFAAHLARLRDAKGTGKPPDLIVLSLQEVAPLAHSFLGGRLLVPYFSRFVQAVNISAAPGDAYRHLATRNVGMTAMMVMTRASAASRIRAAQFAGVGVGHLEMGNKGAVGVRLALDRPGSADPVYLTAVAAHLAPMEDACQRRNEDWRNIVRGLVFTATDTATGARRTGEAEAEPLLENGASDSIAQSSGMFDNHRLVIVGGDLNYRTSDVAPSQTEYHTFPKPDDYKHGVPIASHEPESKLAAYHRADQLSREKAAGNTLHLLEEQPVSFPPTYKYATGSGADWPSDGSEPSRWRWSRHRFPSWCDRVLFSAGLVEAPTGTFSPTAYMAFPLQRTSDHRPVALCFEVDLDRFAQNQALMTPEKAPFALDVHWQARRLRARQLEILVGGVAYLLTTWEGNALLGSTVLGAIGGWFIISSMMGS